MVILMSVILKFLYKNNILKRLEEKIRVNIVLKNLRNFGRMLDRLWGIW